MRAFFKEMILLRIAIHLWIYVLKEKLMDDLGVSRLIMFSFILMANESGVGHPEFEISAGYWMKKPRRQQLVR